MGQPFEYEAPLQKGIVNAVIGYLSDTEGVRGFEPLIVGAIGLVEHLADELLHSQPPPQPLACHHGCGHCCLSAEVHVSPIEIFAIVEHIAQNFDEAAIESLLLETLEVQEDKEKHDVLADRSRGFSCPLQKDDACMIYAMRPFTCRGFNSYSAQNCEKRKREGDMSVSIEGYIHLRRISERVHLGIQQGLTALNLDYYPLDLVPALLITLTAPDAREQWLAGKPVFAQARAKLLET